VLDHLAAGRVGWNSVTTAHAATAAAFGIDDHLNATERYRRADEFIEIVVDLWESWDADAIVDDKVQGIFADPTKIHEIRHAGPNFSVQAQFPLPRSRQGRPVIFHAGSSPQGRDQAARVADVVFTAQHMTDGAVEFRADIRSRAAAYGRDPDAIKVLPGINIVLAPTMAEAEDKKAALDDALTVDQKLRSMSFRTGLPVETLRQYLDQPFPVELLIPDDKLQGGTGWRKSTVDLAVAEGLTVRQLLARAPSGHHHVVGTPAMVADVMMERLETGAADGFVLMIDVLPEGMNDVVELLVPELQRRGVFHKEYSHTYLRDSLQIGPPRPLPTKEVVALSVS
jgi:FMN-dependent oxidoreductase (nitrilotriacetate monooxygenase family)